MGQPVITLAAQSALEQAGVSPTALLARHLHGDWGELDIADIASNELALLIHRRLLSSYVIPGGGRIWIITGRSLGHDDPVAGRLLTEPPSHAHIAHRATPIAGWALIHRMQLMR
jgi:hypothetical protein